MMASQITRVWDVVIPEYATEKDTGEEQLCGLSVVAGEVLLDQALVLGGGVDHVGAGGVMVGQGILPVRPAGAGQQ